VLHIETKFIKSEKLNYYINKYKLSGNRGGKMDFDTQIKCEDKFIIDCFYSMIKEKNANRLGTSFVLRGYLEIIVGYLINISKEKGERREHLPALPL